MIFKSDAFSATWDTWMYCEHDKYYLYYLITEHSPGEGFGVAVSEDGVHFRDLGKAIWASEQMVFYLGTGSVWKSVDFASSGLYCCNYSEWRRCGEDMQQCIFFALSKDLIHWDKCSALPPFTVDDAHYRRLAGAGARWDCIFPLAREEGGYYGYWTAGPNCGAGVGFGSSDDGLHWQAAAPPVIELGPFAGEREIEAGAVCRHNGKVYLMAGCYGHALGVGIYMADAPEGPFRPMKNSFGLFSNRKNMHAYFPRFFYHQDELLANFHVLLRESNDNMRPITYLSPIKKVVFSADGTLRLYWWKQNQLLYKQTLQKLCDACIVEGTLNTLSGEPLVLSLKNGSQLELRLDGAGALSYSCNGMLEEQYARDMTLDETARVRLLIRGTLTELYADDYFMSCYTLPAGVKAISGNIQCATIWGLAL